MGKKKPVAGDSTSEKKRAPARAAVTMPDSRAESIAADKSLNDGRPHIVRAVEHDGVVYKPGDEEALAAAEGFDAGKERLTIKGAIIGF